MKKIIILLFLTIIVNQSYAIMTTSCTRTIENYNFKVTDIIHFSETGKFFQVDASLNMTQSDRAFGFKDPDDPVYLTQGYINPNKYFQTPYARRGPTSNFNAHYYLEWWGALKYCASNNAPSEINADGSLQSSRDVNCAGGNHLTLDIVSQCHKKEGSSNTATGVGFWWSVTLEVNDMDPANTIIKPKYMGMTNGTCILNNTPYGCAPGDHK